MSEGQQILAQRSYIGFGVPLMTLNADYHFIANRHGLAPDSDTSFSIRRDNGFAFGITAGYVFRFGMYTNGAILGMDLGVGYDYYTWKSGKNNFLAIDDGNSKLSDWSIPISFFYKRGSEAEYTSQKRTMFSLGVGIEPGKMSMNYLGSETKAWKFRPFAVGEVGVFAGRALKLRLRYYPLKTIFVDQESTYTDGLLATKVSGLGNVTLTFIIMMYSNHWGEQ